MRPVNLIPPEERRGEHAPLRTGPLPYVLLAALILALVGVTAMVLTSNQISESKSELATLKSEDATAAAKARRLSAYTRFREMSEQRVATVQSLADSRFDWERVMRELSLVLPTNVWLVGLTATASPVVTIDGATGGGTGASLRAQVAGPALELNGCATGQDAVAGFVTALKDIDGVTRVAVESSELGEEKTPGEQAETPEAGANTGAGDDECRTRSSIAKFSIVVAFDAAPVPEEESSSSTVASTSESSASTSESSQGTEGG